MRPTYNRSTASYLVNIVCILRQIPGKAEHAAAVYNMLVGEVWPVKNK